MRFRIKLTHILLLAACAFVPAFAFAQTEETVRALQVQADDDTQADSTQKKEEESCCLIKKNSYIRFLNADGGISTVLNTVNGKNYSASGPMWAVGAHLAYKLPMFNTHRRMFFSGGIEVRNFFATASETDRFGGTAYNNLRYLYAGIPVTLQVVNTKCAPGKKCTFRYYGQFGLTLAAVINVSNDYSIQGNNTTYNITQHYHTFIFQPIVSAGISINTPKCTYLVGPYCGYAINNLLSNTGINENILSYGLRLSTLFWHK